MFSHRTYSEASISSSLVGDKIANAPHRTYALS